MATFRKTAFLFCFAATLLGQSVPVTVRQVGSNIVVFYAGGKSETLTTTGRDRSPWIACDGHTVLFVRSANEDVFRTSVEMIDLRSRKESVLFAGPIDFKGQTLKEFSNPRLDARRERLFLIANTSVTTGELFAIDLPNGAVRHVSDAASFEVIQRGDYAGNLLLYQRKRSPLNLGPLYFVYWLFSPMARDLGMAGLDGTSFRSVTSCAP
jgi:hypothetical protein